MDKKLIYKRFTDLLLSLPDWPKEQDRYNFVRSAFLDFDESLLHHYQYQGPGHSAAFELVKLCDEFDIPSKSGVTPLCALLAEVHQRKWAGGKRAKTVAELEQALGCPPRESGPKPGEPKPTPGPLPPQPVPLPEPRTPPPPGSPTTNGHSALIAAVVYSFASILLIAALFVIIEHFRDPIKPVSPGPANGHEAAIQVDDALDTIEVIYPIGARGLSSLATQVEHELKDNFPKADVTVKSIGNPFDRIRNWLRSSLRSFFQSAPEDITVRLRAHYSCEQQQQLNDALNQIPNVNVHSPLISFAPNSSPDATVIIGFGSRPKAPWEGRWTQRFAKIGSFSGEGNLWLQTATSDDKAVFGVYNVAGDSAKKGLGGVIKGFLSDDGKFLEGVWCDHNGNPGTLCLPLEDDGDSFKGAFETGERKPDEGWCGDRVIKASSDEKLDSCWIQGSHDIISNVIDNKDCRKQLNLPRERIEERCADIRSRPSIPCPP